jgi:hypothetical protein
LICSNLGGLLFGTLLEHGALKPCIRWWPLVWQFQSISCAATWGINVWWVPSCALWDLGSPH